MIPFWAETLLLMAVAYILGAALACVIRRSLAPAAHPAASVERRVDPLPEVAQRQAQAARPAASPRPAVAAATPQPQDLKSIRGLDPAAEAKLKALGISRYEQIAAWLRADVERVEQALGQRGRVARENWIEQAQILAKGGQTLFSVRRARGEGSTAAPTPDEGVPAAPAAAAALPRPMSRVGVSAVVIAPQAEAAVLPPSPHPRWSPTGRPSPSSPPYPSVPRRPRPATTCSASAASPPRSRTSSTRWGSPAIQRSHSGRRPRWSTSTKSSAPRAAFRARTGSSRRRS
jgi:predicted flap endonuclease-1-like 5' DNA nuclease